MTIAGRSISALLFAAAISGHAVAEQKAAGYVTQLAGEVRIARAGETAGIAPKLLDPVYLNDLITTGKGAHAGIFLEGNRLVEIAPGSSIRLEGALSDGTGVVELLLGKIRAIVQPLDEAPNRFQVVTPNAIAGVAGTSFVVDYAEVNGTTRIYVLAGKVRVRNRAEKAEVAVLLPAGKWTEVAQGNAPAQGRDISSDIRENAIEGLPEGDAGGSLGAGTPAERAALVGLPAAPSAPGPDADGPTLPKQVTTVGTDYISPQQLGAPQAPPSALIRVKPGRGPAAPPAPPAPLPPIKSPPGVLR